MDRDQMTRGMAIHHVRQFLYVDERGRKLSQVRLYERCAEIEKANPPATRHVYFAYVSEDTAKEKVGNIESNRTELTVHQLEIIARAFGLSADFFYYQFPDPDSLEEAYRHRKRTAEKGATLAGASQDVLFREASATVSGFLRIEADDPIPACRIKLAEELSEFISLERERRPKLILLEGQTGVGKSFFLSYWVRSHSGGLIIEGKVCLDCSNLSVDQLIPALQEHVPLVPKDTTDEKTPSHARPDAGLIVLDGLQGARFREGGIRSDGEENTRPSFGDLIDKISPLLSASHPNVMIICIEVNGRGIPDRVVMPRLPPTVSFKRLRIDPLPVDESAQLLGLLGAENINERQRQAVARKLLGLPLALVVAANELVQLTPAQRESYLDTVAPDLTRGRITPIPEDFAKFFRSWVQRADAAPSAQPYDPSQEADPSSHALLRMLSLMPGPLPREYLHEIIRPRRLRRLRRLSVESVFHREIPFTMIIDDAVDIHAMVRDILRTELMEFVRSGSYDGFTSAEEIEWTHWKCAVLNWAFLKRETDTDIRTISAVEAFVYHMMAQARMLPKGKRANRRARSAFSAGISPNLIERFEERSGQLSNAQLWSFAFEKAVRPILLESRHEATRVYGQYEAKARILLYLVDVAVEEEIPVAPLTLTELHKEIALCWLHAGRLNSARHAILHAKTALEQQRTHTRVPSRSGHDAITQEHWRILCDVASVEATIDLRLGRVVDQIEDDLLPLESAASRIIGQHSGGGVIGPSALNRGALRVTARIADVALSRGDLDKALRLFEEINAIQILIRGHQLDGDAARRWVVALIRTRAVNPEHMQKAENLIEANIARHEGFRKFSIDIIPFLTLRAALYRISGRSNEAKNVWLRIQQHENVIRGECTFVSLCDIELEGIRIQSVSEDPGKELFSRTMSLVRRLENAHHWPMAHDAKLVAAELAPEPEKGKLLFEARQFFRTTNYRLKLVDIEEITNGGSATRRFGL